MSSTNKTTNLQLSQFLGTDKPAWLGDYNLDMQKIDDGYAALKNGEATSTADIAALQQKDTQLDQDIKDTNDRIDSIATNNVALGNRVTTLEGNYDTMHHEVAVAQQDIINNTDGLDGLTDEVEFMKSNLRPFVTVYLDPVNGVDDDKRNGSASAPFKTFAYFRKRFAGTGHLDLHLIGGTFNEDFPINNYTDVVVYVDGDTTINGYLVAVCPINIKDNAKTHRLTVDRLTTEAFSLLENITILNRANIWAHCTIQNCTIGLLVARRCNLNLNDVTLIGGTSQESGKAGIIQGCNLRWSSNTNDVRNKFDIDGSVVLLTDDWDSQKTSDTHFHIEGSWVHMTQDVFDRVKNIGYDYNGSVLANKGLIGLTE